MTVRRRPSYRPRGRVQPPAAFTREVQSTATLQQRFHWDRLPLVLFGFFFLGLWWVSGGKWTIEGMPLLLNEVFHFLHITVRLKPITNPWWFLGLVWLPIGISYVEHKYAPWRAWSKYAIMAMPLVIGIWLIVTAADWGSTWMAITHPDPDAWLIARQVAAIPFLAGLWVSLTTFIPEVGFAVLMWWLWEPDPKP